MAHAVSEETRKILPLKPVFVPLLDPVGPAFRQLPEQCVEACHEFAPVCEV